MPTKKSFGSNLRGDRGEFFTPRNICKMTVAMLDPGERQVILDPACGTGGFLITAMNYVIEKIRTAEISKWGDVERAETAIRKRVERVAKKYIVGNGSESAPRESLQDEHGHEQ